MWQPIVGILGVLVASFFGMNCIGKFAWHDEDLVRGTIVLFAAGMAMALAPLYF